jgi:hypothetical protein
LNFFARCLISFNFTIELINVISPLFLFNIWFSFFYITVFLAFYQQKKKSISSSNIEMLFLFLFCFDFRFAHLSFDFEFLFWVLLCIFFLNFTFKSMNIIYLFFSIYSSFFYITLFFFLGGLLSNWFFFIL